MSLGAAIEVVQNVRLDLAFLKRSPSAIAILREDGLLVFRNDAAERLFAPDEGQRAAVVGENIDRWGPPGFARERIELMRSLAASGRDGIVRDVWKAQQIITYLRLLPPFPGEAMRYFMTVHERMQGPVDAGQFPGQVFHEPEVQDLGMLALLSPRELEVLALVGQGLTAEQIGRRLHRSIDTVNSHKAACLKKLKCQNATQLATIAYRAGLTFTEPEDD